MKRFLNLFKKNDSITTANSEQVIKSKFIQHNLIELTKMCRKERGLKERMLLIRLIILYQSQERRLKQR